MLDENTKQKIVSEMTKQLKKTLSCDSYQMMVDGNDRVLLFEGKELAREPIDSENQNKLIFTAIFHQDERELKLLC